MKNLKRTLFIFTGLSSLLFLTGCFATQDDVSVLKTQVSALNKTLQEMQRNQASSSQQMETLGEKLTQSSENLKDFDFKLDALSAKLDNITSMVTAAAQKQTEYKMLPGDIFEEAQTQFEAGQFDLAVKGFNLYLKSAPEGQYAQDTYLMLGESYFNQKDYQRAAVSAATLLDKYPGSKQTAAARVLYAKSILPLNKKEEAKTYLKSVVQDFKDTPQAEQAKKLLEGIK